MLATTTTDLAILIAAIAAAIVSIITAIQTGKVHGEVKTMNGLRMGELADAAETRRIETLPTEERTAADNEHVAIIPSEDSNG